MALPTIPKPQFGNNPKLRVAVITDVGFKANGVVAYDVDEFREILDGPADGWIIFETLEYKEQNTAYMQEVVCIKRSHLIAWAISPIATRPITIAHRIPDL